ncbi:hypothetical protein AB1L05_16680 [Cytobacillus horneckiae]|uniref:spermidine synthase n=1 Tax=Cytobacillus horneckiae TaxID=549687 RepID=UPI00399F2488
MNKVKAKKTGLYSSRELLLNSIESLISSDRIFVGNQPDDFGIGGVISSGNKVLMLGLGFGGSIRPLISTIEDVQITAIDSDLNILNACSAIMNSYFPLLKNIKYIHGDATNFENYTLEKFDLICIDIYTEKGYPDFIFNDNFWSKVSESLTKDGKVIVNSWGLPYHLNPLFGNSPQKGIANMLIKNYKSVYSLPYRRNITFICSNSLIEAKRINSMYELNVIDKLHLDLFLYRFTHSEKINFSSENEDVSILKNRDDIDNEMGIRWPSLISNINKHLEGNDLEKIDNKSLKELVYDEDRATKVIISQLKNNDIEASFFPISIGALAFSESNKIDWFSRWLAENSKLLYEINPQWLINHALWQVLSIAANPFCDFNNIEEEIKQIIKDIKLF